MKNITTKQEMTSTNIGDTLAPFVENDKELTDDQKQELRKSALEGKERLEKQIRDFTADKSIAAQLFEEAFLQLYDKNFTESELRELVVFYRTPTGQKSAKFMSSFMREWTKAFSEAFGKKFRDFANSKLQEEIELLKQKIIEAKRKKLEA